MNFEMYTDRARGFVQSAQTIALREGHQQLTPEHLLKALLDDSEGMAAGLIRKAGGDPKAALLALDADSREQVIPVPGAVSDLDIDGKRIAARRERVGVVEVVDQLLDAHGTRRRQRPLSQEPADVGVRVGSGLAVGGTGVGVVSFTQAGSANVRPNRVRMVNA